ncbi:MAG: hypothetical protein JRJ15_13095 [Deltaproteobacteria bacterium]|nr:hypothetical protein [Deltaproteobacteria bacterium]
MDNKNIDIPGKSLITFILAASVICFMICGTALSFVTKEGDKTYIVDRTGERWDVSQAKSIGFRPERFQYGIGRNAFTPLDDSYLSDNPSHVPKNLRVLGVREGAFEQAYSIPKLSRHEIANTKIGSQEIAVGY